MNRPNIRIRKSIKEDPPDINEARIVADTDEKLRKKRPPNSGSMKPGETRNPNGRPKGAKGVKAIVRKVLHEKTEIRTTKGKRKVTIYEALLKQELQHASEGDFRARKTLIELGRWALLEENPETTRHTASPPSEVDQAILDWFADDVRAMDEQKSDEK